MCQPYLTQRVYIYYSYQVVSQKFILAQISQPILYASNRKEQVDSFVGELTFVKRRGDVIEELAKKSNREQDKDVPTLPYSKYLHIL